jgi:MoaA/NifB/PqqE/SkfB family radical SAM enzyme
MEMEKKQHQGKIFCSAPFSSMRLFGNGTVTPCCLINKPMGFLSSSSNTEEILNSDLYQSFRQSFMSGEFSSLCTKCKDREEAVGHSMRYLYNQTLCPMPEGSRPETTMLSFPQIQHLDLNFSFACNLKCRMCSAFRSSKWQEDEIELAKVLSFRTPAPQKHFDVRLKTDYYRRLIDLCPNLQRIDIKGGEPLISKECWEFLQYLVEKGRSKQILLSFTTNGLVVPGDLSILKEFRRVTICFSIEGVGDSYRYIRGQNRSIQELEDNLKKFDSLENLDISFNFTFQAYNIFQVIPTLEWLVRQSRELTKFNLQQLRLDQCILTSPEYLKATVLPFSIRQRAAEQIRNHKLYLAFKTILDPLVEYLLNQNLDDTGHIGDFKKFTVELDRIRKEDVHAALPELADLF